MRVRCDCQCFISMGYIIADSHWKSDWKFKRCSHHICPSSYRIFLNFVHMQSGHVLPLDNLASLLNFEWNRCLSGLSFNPRLLVDPIEEIALPWVRSLPGNNDSKFERIRPFAYIHSGVHKNQSDWRSELFFLREWLVLDSEVHRGYHMSHFNRWLNMLLDRRTVIFAY